MSKMSLKLKGSLMQKKQLEIIEESDNQVKDSAEVHSFNLKTERNNVKKKFNDYGQDESDFANDGWYSQSVES